MNPQLRQTSTTLTECIVAGDFAERFVVQDGGMIVDAISERNEKTLELHQGVFDETRQGLCRFGPDWFSF